MKMLFAAVHESPNGTNRTNRADLMMSVPRGNRKWRFGAVRTAVDPNQSDQGIGSDYCSPPDLKVLG